VYENNRMCNHHSSSVLVGEHVYGFNEQTLTCLDLRTGKVAWKQGRFGKGTVLVADGNLIVLGENGWMALAATNPQEYTEKSRFRYSEGRCWTAPVLAQARLYARDDRRVVCYDLRQR